MQPQHLTFLFVSRHGDSIDLAWAVAKEGHTVLVFIEMESEKTVGDGFVEKVDNWEMHTDQADIIVFDYIGEGERANALRAQGKLVIGGTPYTDTLENDRSFGQEQLKKHGVKILPYHTFHTFESAVQHVRGNPNKYVIKPSGEVQDYKQLLFVGNEDDGSDIIRILQAYERTWGNEIEEFQLQRRASGVEIGIGAFFNGKKFIDPINVNFEHKKLFPGELGVSTGEMGTSMFWTSHNPIFEATLRKMEATFAREEYVGYIDINCIVNGNGIYPLEFTCRFGYPTISIQRAGITEPIGMMLWKLASGIDFQLKTKRGFQVGVMVVVPPFPYSDQKTFDVFSQDAVVVFKKESREGIHIQDLQLINDEWLITGVYGIPLIVTGTGTTMKEAQRQAYSRIQNILIPNMYYRTDIGDRWVEDGDKLHSWGYL
ncbi:MAG: phosphoribosylamine--glycine ligase [Candidatus Peregrinibacteria bacterium]|nr:phosphoribosylamine--glycine ligase [Candidatus Peregrinibacteria bacterium]MCB9807898.1 phosphoribosylamine--glycine ligase [Candidatus Peribacteria bacterium]